MMSKYIPEDEAMNMAINILRKKGILEKDRLKLTDYGVTRDNMTESDRAIDREAKRSGRRKEDYYYEPLTNRAKLINSKSKKASF